nr:hypothetical protein [Tanacetum cinerariifolium]
MIAILEKSEHNIDFHQIVDFIEASHISPKSTCFKEFSSNIATVVAQQSPHHDPLSPSHPTATIESIPTAAPTETSTLRQYFRRATRIAQSKALSPASDEPASLLRDDSQGEAFPTVTENIIKTSALPHDSTPRVTSLDADEGSMQQQLQELMDLYTSLQRQQTEMATKIEAQDLEISSLKARIKLFEDKERGRTEPAQEDAPIKGRSIKIEEEVRVERSTKLGSNDTEEMVNVLSSMEAANILTSGVAAVSVPPVARVSTVGVPAVSRLVPTEKVEESEEPNKKKLQEQIDAQVAREIEEEITREDQRINEQLARDAEIARIHAEEELKMLIDGLDMSNEVIAKHLQKYEESEAELTIGEKIDLINELNHAGWKTKHFRGMTLEEIREKFIPVWKQIEDFVPMSLTEEAQRVKRKGLKLDEGSAKRMKTSKDEEDLKGMMQLVSVEDVYVEALQVKHPIID